MNNQYDIKDLNSAKGQYAVIGYPVSHSISPKLHALLVEGCGYHAAEVIPEHLSDFCESARKSLSGFNVTIPHKKSIIKHLESIDPAAAEIGSVNTVKVENRRLCGYNTDIYGFTKTLETHGAALNGKSVLILGAGGVALTAVYASLKAGALVTVAARDILKAQADFKNIPVIDINGISGKYEIVVNCTDCGMGKQEGIAPADITKISGCRVLFDLVYNPLKTRLIKDAENSGISTVNGLEMLIYQAAKAQEIWGNKPVLDMPKLKNVLIGEIIAQRLKKRGKSGIALCGFMACGKSSVARYLSSVYGFERIDTDEEIIKMSGTQIPQIFQKYGEAAFRNFETEALKNINAGDKPCVISLGGGAVIKEGNAETVKRNNILVYIEVSLETALERAGKGGERPLLNKSAQEIINLYNYRRDIYSANCDFKVFGGGSVKDTAEQIIENI